MMIKKAVQHYCNGRPHAKSNIKFQDGQWLYPVGIDDIGGEPITYCPYCGVRLEIPGEHENEQRSAEWCEHLLRYHYD